MLLSQILCNALNNGLETNEAVMRLADRWELVFLEHPPRSGFRGGWVVQADAVCIDGEMYHTQDAFECDCCNQQEHNRREHSVYALTFGRGLRQRAFCEQCFEDYAFCCESCSDLYHTDLCHTDRQGQSFCNECYDARTDEQKNEHALLFSYGQAAEPSNPYGWQSPLYSAELEMESEEDERKELVEALHMAGIQRLTTEKDGSLSDDTGVECQLSFFASLEDLSHELDLLATTAKAKGAKSWDAPSAPSVGLHISSNCRSGWTPKQRTRLAYYVRACKAELVNIAGREVHYASFPAGFLVEWAKGNVGKFVAVRLGWDRIEWRLFRGTLNSKRLALYCKTVGLFEHHAKMATKVQSANEIKQGLSTLRDALCDLVQGAKDDGIKFNN